MNKDELIKILEKQMKICFWELNVFNIEPLAKLG